MGYRHYFYLISNKDVEELSTISWEDFKVKYEYVGDQDDDQSEPYIPLYRIFTQVFEFGKLYWDDTAKMIYDLGRPLFLEPMMKRYEDYEPYVVGKEAVLKAIEIYQEKIAKYFEEIQAEQESRLSRLEEYFKDRCRWLSWKTNVDLEKKYEVTKSWQYEDSIFNLVHILKSIDWDTHSLVFFGW